MKLHIKERQYNWGDSFYVLTDENQRIFHVKSSVLLWNRKFEISDLDRNVLVTIKQEPKSLLKPKYYVTVDGHPTFSITRELSLVPEYTFEGLDWQMHGLMLHEYEMRQNGQTVFTFREEVTPWSTRGVLTAEPSQILTALAVVMTITYAMNAKDSETSTQHL